MCFQSNLRISPYIAVFRPVLWLLKWSFVEGHSLLCCLHDSTWLGPPPGQWEERKQQIKGMSPSCPLFLVHLVRKMGFLLGFWVSMPPPHHHTAALWLLKPLGEVKREKVRPQILWQRLPFPILCPGRWVSCGFFCCLHFLHSSIFGPPVGQFWVIQRIKTLENHPIETFLRFGPSPNLLFFKSYFLYFVQTFSLWWVNGATVASLSGLALKD